MCPFATPPTSPSHLFSYALTHRHRPATHGRAHAHTLVAVHNLFDPYVISSPHHQPHIRPHAYASAPPHAHKRLPP
jgi:hypothetical protein